MKSLAEFNFEQKGPASRSAEFPSPGINPPSTLRDELHRAANRGLHLFPVTKLAKLTGRPDLLIGEATCDVDLLKELADKNPSCAWRAAIGLSKVCVVQLDGPEARTWWEVSSIDEGECLTLQARWGDRAWAFFRWPTGLVLRPSVKKLPHCVRILAEGDSCPIPPSGGCVWSNPWAEIEAVPDWLRHLAFEPQDNPPVKNGRSPAPMPLPRSASCRPSPHYAKLCRGTRKGYPNSNQASWHGGYRIHRQR